MVFLHGQVETFTKESIKKMKGMAMEKWNGQMAVFIKVNGTKVYSMAMVKWYSQMVL